LAKVLSKKEPNKINDRLFSKEWAIELKEACKRFIEVR